MMVEESLLTIGLFCWLFLKVARENEERQRLLDYAEEHEIALDERRAARAVAAGRGDELLERLRAGAGTAAHLPPPTGLISVPNIPAALVAAEPSRTNVYVPGLRVAVTVDVPPVEPIAPIWLRPPPVIAMSWLSRRHVLHLQRRPCRPSRRRSRRGTQLAGRVGVDLEHPFFSAALC